MDTPRDVPGPWVGPGAHAVDPARPLDGIRVVEVSSFVAAPTAGMLLAQLGADVIRVDPVEGALDQDRWPTGHDGRSLYWEGLNKGKRSLCLDFRSEDGRELLRRLVHAPGSGAGVLVTNRKMPWLTNTSGEHATRDDLIVVSLTGMPDGSPAVDYTVNSRLGYAFLTGSGDRPVNHVLPAWDLLAGHQIVIAVLAALRRRAESGDGSNVSLSLWNVALSTASSLGVIAAAELRPTKPREATGNWVYGTFGGDFATRDGSVLVVALTHRHWRDLVELTGTSIAIARLEDLSNSTFDHEGVRYEHRRAIADAMSPWFRTRTTVEVAEAMESRSLLWAPFGRFEELIDDPRHAPSQNPMFYEGYRAGEHTVTASASPLHFEGRGYPRGGATPEMGEDNTDVLRDVLALDPEQIDALEATGCLRSAGQAPPLERHTQKKTGCRGQLATADHTRHPIPQKTEGTSR